MIGRTSEGSLGEEPTAPPRPVVRAPEPRLEEFERLTPTNPALRAISLPTGQAAEAWAEAVRNWGVLSEIAVSYGRALVERLNMDLCDINANTEEGTPYQEIVEWGLGAGEVLSGLYPTPASVR
ncbi:MAG: hypothetical protein ACYDFT_05280 [Thermoplasmata archaeon]